MTADDFGLTPAQQEALECMTRLTEEAAQFIEQVNAQLYDPPGTQG